jgi:hypothetical protein
VWETDRTPRHWPELLNAVDRVIVLSEWNRAVFEADGVHVPISVVPHVACDPVVASDDAVAALDLPDDDRLLFDRALGRTQGDVPRRARSSTPSPPTIRSCWW